MRTDILVWPSVAMPIKQLTAARGRHTRMLKMVQEHPKLYKRPTDVRRKAQEAIAQYDAALKVLRDAERAMAAPRRKRSGSAGS